jgi:hypothetical protein
MPISVPASCDFMVAQPPSYEESIYIYNNSHKSTNISQPIQNKLRIKKSRKMKTCIIL